VKKNTSFLLIIGAAVAGLFGYTANLTVEQILTVIAALVGLPMLWALVIDILKWLGVVTDGNAGKWSAGLNLLSLVTVAFVMKFMPQVNITAVDAAIIEVAKFGALVFGYIIQIVDSKAAHDFFVRVLKITAFSHSQLNA